MELIKIFQRKSNKSMIFIFKKTKKKKKKIKNQKMNN